MDLATVFGFLLAWGAVNARQRPASPKIKQVALKLDYSGGWLHHRQTWKTFKNVCGAYDGPDLRWLVTACKALDRVVRAGRYWVPHYYKPTHWLAYWDVFSRPATKPRYGRGLPETWWYDHDKAARIERAG